MNFALTCCVLLVAAFLPFSGWNDSTPLSVVLSALGDSSALQRNAPVTGADSMLIRQGHDIVHRGYTVTDRGDSSERVSRYFVCTDCHNTDIEDPDLRVGDPEARLRFVSQHDLPFLQGTTLKGVVNRESWYNGDYAEKYGRRALQAHDDIREAVQLCAEECSLGRPLEGWELEAVLAYLRSIEYTLGDLNLSDATWTRLLESSEEDDPSMRMALLTELKSYYLHASPATFLPPPDDPAVGYGPVGDPERGEAIYRLSCLHCHEPGRVTRLELQKDAPSFKRLERKILRTRESGFYPVIRNGTYPEAEHPQYMPRYPAERMSNQQIEDLRAYIEARVRK